jgi:hypothetical protein
LAFAVRVPDVDGLLDRPERKEEENDERYKIGGDRRRRRSYVPVVSDLPIDRPRIDNSTLPAAK